MLMADTVMDADEPRFQIGEDEMDDRQIVLGNLWVAALGNGKVFIPALAEAGISTPIVSDGQRPRSNGALHEPTKRVGAPIGYYGEPDTPGIASVLSLVLRGSRFPMTNLDGTSDENLVVDTPAFATSPSTNPCLVYLNMFPRLAADTILIGPHHASAELVENAEGRLIARQAKLSLKLNRRDAGRLAGDQISRPKPCAQRHMAAFHDGANRQARIVAALATAQDTGTSGDAEGIACGMAMRTDEAVAPSSFFHVGSTLRFIGKKLLKLWKRPRKGQVVTLKDVHGSLSIIHTKSIPSGCVRQADRQAMKNKLTLFRRPILLIISALASLTLFVAHSVNAINIEPVRISGEFVRDPCSLQNISSNGELNIRTDTAILFVHGIGGHPVGTFTSSSILSDCETRADTLLNDMLIWLKLEKPMQYMTLFELLHKDEDGALGQERLVGEIDLYTLDYTDAFDASDISIAEIAHQIRVDSSFLSLLSNYNHIFIVTHSLGGVITKKVLIDLRHFDRNASLSRILGVGLLGVPSSGSPLASIVSGNNNLQTIVGYFIADNPALWDDLQSIEYSGSFLRDVEDKWHDMVFDSSERGHSVYSACGHETKFEVEFLSLEIVPELYAKTSCSRPSYPFSKKHTDLPKPVDSNPDQESTHKWLVRSLKEAFRHLELIGVRRWNDVNVPLGVLLEHIDLASKSTESQSDLQYVTTRVEIGNHTERKLFRRFFPWIPVDGYSSPTYAGLLYAMSRDSENGCMEVHLDPKRRVARVDLVEYVQCKTKSGDLPDIACVPAACPEKPLRMD